METYINCWEFMDCGRETGGKHTDKYGTCPASTEQRLDKVHGGKNAGRCCWAVSGTFARGQVTGTWAKKCNNCELCEFYRRVKDEEGIHFWPPFIIHKMLRLRQ